MANSSKEISILVAPLDWGLGHATRCIPIIRALLQSGCRVVLAADGPQKTLLVQEFPHLECLSLPGYGIRYGKKRLLWQLVKQLPRLARAIRSEQVWLQQAIVKHRLDGVISDNRYGLFSKTIPSVLITHQLQLHLPKALAFGAGILRWHLYRYINRFSECWVPDVAGLEGSLSGSLGHPEKTPAIPVHYLGWLTRFSPGATAIPPLYDALIVLSGPEPQRSLLEDLLVQQLRATKGNMLLVRGLPGSTTGLSGLPANVVVSNHLNANALQAAFLQSKYLISRSGYSTLMDAFTLGKKCIVLPTPGQTEQEYLAQTLDGQGMVMARKQEGFQLGEALAAADRFTFAVPPAPKGPLLMPVLTRFLNAIALHKP